MFSVLVWLFQAVVLLAQMILMCLLLIVLTHGLWVLAHRPSVTEAVSAYCRVLTEGLLSLLQRGLAPIREASMRRAAAWLVLCVLLIGTNQMTCSLARTLEGPQVMHPPKASARALSKQQRSITAEEDLAPRSMPAAPP